MMGRQTGDQSQLFYLFNLERRIPASNLLRRINPVVTRILAELRDKLAAFYSDIGRPSIDPELMIRMLIIGYCYGIRSERRLCEEVDLHLAYRWFCRLDLDDQVPDHSTFSVNRHGRFRDSDILRQVFEAVVRACMDAGLVKGEGFAVDASVIEANASRYHGKASGEIDWSVPERQTRAAAEFLAGLDDEDPDADHKPPKAISPSDPCSAWTAKANKRVQFGYALNYLIDIAHAIIVDVEPTPARSSDEVASTKTMLVRTERCFGLKPKRLAADTAYGTAKFLDWLIGARIAPHIPVWPNADFLLFSRNWIRYRKLLRLARQICNSQAIIEKGIVLDIDANRNVVLDCIADLYQPVRQPVAQAVVIEHRHDDVNVGFELDQALSRIRHGPLGGCL